MIDKELSKRASAQDRVLLKTLDPKKVKLLAAVGKKWRMKRVPLLGTVISDPDMIRAVMDGMGDTITGFWGQETAATGFACMNPLLQEVITETLTPERMESIRESVVTPMLFEAVEELHAGMPVDMVELASRVCYLSMWKALGLSEDRLKALDFNMIVRTLRAATEVLTKNKHANTEADQTRIENMLLFFTTILSEAYNDTNTVSLLSRMRDAKFSEKQTISLAQSVFLSGADSVVRFIPRMSALFVKSGYLNHLVDDPTNLLRGMDEAYRVACPVPSIVLRVNKPILLADGVTVEADTKTILSMVGASEKYGSFNPFSEETPGSVGFGKPFPLSVGSGDHFARMVVEEFGKFLMKANEGERLEVVAQSSDDKGHVGSYKKLVLALKKAQPEN